MVSFQCEGCGDVLTKKKLDSHRGQCSRATYTCLDCMTHFQGNTYKAHTSCISEEQKYQGALFKEKSGKKSVKIAPNPSTHPPRAYVEDAPDPDTGTAVATVNAPPEAPPPPPPPPVAPETTSTPKPNVNVFDFMVNEDTPSASKNITTPGDNKDMNYTPSILGSDVATKKSVVLQDPHYDRHGFSYGADPVPAISGKERPRVEYVTPGSKDLQRELRAFDKSRRYDNGSTDKKRKRTHAEVRIAEDAIMTDAPPVLHSGLTSGLNRLLSRSSHSPRPYEDQTPFQHTRHSTSITTSQPIAHRDRSKSAEPTNNNALVRVKKRRTTTTTDGAADGEKLRKRKKKRKHRSTSDDRDDEARPHRRAIEYNLRRQDADGVQHAEKQMILYPRKRSRSRSRSRSEPSTLQYQRAELFMSLVTKGEESNRGMSMHKVLKRYHRETKKQLQIVRASDARQMVREDEEKELWKGLRLRRNEHGEIVVSMD